MQTPPAFTWCALLPHVVLCVRRLQRTTDKNTDRHFPLFNPLQEKTGGERAALLHQVTAQRCVI